MRNDCDVEHSGCEWKLQVNAVQASDSLYLRSEYNQ